MIYSLYGKIQSRLSNAVVMDVNGVGFLVYTTLPILASLSVGDKVMMYTHFHVREDQMSLAGFLNQEYLDIFEKVISVSGVGIKAGLAILSINNPGDIKNAIASGKVEVFEKISGIGKKTAQKIILELRGKIDFNKRENTTDDEAKTALVSLGFTEKEAKKALKNISSGMTLEEKIIKALKGSKS